jgi:hypothetical protein
LDDGGERITLEVPLQNVKILDFTYNDSWYPVTDGDGAALQIVNALAAPSQWDKRSGWQASALSPGATPAFGVYAGETLITSAGVPVPLYGSVAYGSFAPSAVSVVWSFVSGPAAPNFTTADYQDANARFSGPGVYTLRFTANGPAGATASDDLTVIIPENYTEWATRLLSAPQRDRAADPDADGVPNLAEYAAGSDPLTFNTALEPVMLPQGFAGRFKISRSIPNNVRVSLEASVDLIEWMPASVDHQLESIQSTTETWLGIPSIGSAEGRVYLRVRVVEP